MVNTGRAHGVSERHVVVDDVQNDLRGARDNGGAAGRAHHEHHPPCGIEHDGG